MSFNFDSSWLSIEIYIESLMALNVDLDHWIHGKHFFYKLFTTIQPPYKFWVYLPSRHDYFILVFSDNFICGSPEPRYIVCIISCLNEIKYKKYKWTETERRIHDCDSEYISESKTVYERRRICVLWKSGSHPDYNYYAYPHTMLPLPNE